MRGLIAAVLVLSLTASDVLAAETGALAPGKPAGVTDAQSGSSTFYVIAFSVVLVAGVAFLISTDHSSNNPLTLTSGNAAVSSGINGPAVTTTSQ